jgi:hypothetical protein
MSALSVRPGAIGKHAHRAIGCDQSGQELEIAGAFVFGSLLRFDIQVYAIEALHGVIAIELHDGLDVIEQPGPWGTRLVRIGARDQCLNPDAGLMHVRDQLRKTQRLQRIVWTGYGDIDFVDAFGLAEAANPPDRLGFAQHFRAAPDPQSVHWRLRCVDAVGTGAGKGNQQQRKQPYITKHKQGDTGNS